MIIVTGGSGFIGSHIVKALNQRGITDILVVDDLMESEKFENLSDCVISDYMDRTEFIDSVCAGTLRRTDSIDAILHQGACTDTMETDGRYMMENNYTWSRELLCFAMDLAVPFVYASSGAVYGNSRSFSEDPENERPVNVYGYSKLVLDQHVRTRLEDAPATLVGLRYFNVYGQRERHKGRMASMVYRLYRQMVDEGVGRLFTGTGGYDDGEQRRDFVYVEDVVKANLHFALDSRSPVRGVFNLGTGASRSFNDLAQALIRSLGRGRLEYVPFDERLSGRYQSFTEADLTRLGKLYREPFTPLEEGVRECVENWRQTGAS
ncbi:ADP-glyceromanno-heptose 6-epimerase [Candidatus Fermentibacterales bacterium]|nr:ADP-glyceromanno-heptose 6-epimerase [Candidatus Fermentibacterales bacterium]